MAWVVVDSWSLIESDIHREYAVDLSEPGQLRRRSIRWFEARLAGLSPEARTWDAIRQEQGTIRTEDEALAAEETL